MGLWASIFIQVGLSSLIYKINAPLTPFYGKSSFQRSLWKSSHQAVPSEGWQVQGCPHCPAQSSESPPWSHSPLQERGFAHLRGPALQTLEPLQRCPPASSPWERWSLLLHSCLDPHWSVQPASLISHCLCERYFRIISWYSSGFLGFRVCIKFVLSLH